MKSQKEELKAKDKAEKEIQKKKADSNAAEERRLKDASRVVQVGGKKLMGRSEKPFFKKTKENKQDLTQEQVDFLKYLGELAMPVPPKQ